MGGADGGLPGAGAVTINKEGKPLMETNNSTVLPGGFCANQNLHYFSNSIALVLFCVTGSDIKGQWESGIRKT